MIQQQLLSLIDKGKGYGTGFGIGFQAIKKGFYSLIGQKQKACRY